MLCQLGYLCSTACGYKWGLPRGAQADKGWRVMEQEFFVDVSGDIVEHGLKRLNPG